MRQYIRQRIEKCHEEIDRLIQEEKDYQEARNPQPNSLLRMIRDAKIEWLRHSPDFRRNMSGE